MVMANRNLLRHVRRLAIRDELLAMQLRGRLVAPRTAQPASGPVVGPVGVQASTPGSQPAVNRTRGLDGKE